ncbi:MAG TPA: glycoside hydrolase family 27 protein [Acidobacteriaceae bacterium]|nr:glycoside hydrolase family 27 protein [Acidobacteriaceae bacterium]
MKTSRLFLSLALLLLAALPVSAQTFNGKWAAITSKTRDNGVPENYLLDLKQDGDQITGTMSSLGFGGVGVKGSVTGSHFEIFIEWDLKKPFLSGEIANGEVTITPTEDNPHASLRRATAADEIPKPAYIQPPAIHPVPSNGLAKTPPMGWNSWNLFAGKVDDAIIRTMADAMVSSGMRDAGYVYVNIDDTWEDTRDAQGNLKPNHKFPDMKALADYVHSKGLKLGIYSSPGPHTCGGYPGSYGHESQDAKAYAGWGIDYLKYDWCSAGMIYKNDDLQPVYQKMGAALQSTGRPIVFSLCEYGLNKVEQWGPKVGGNLWRTTGDIRDEWSSMIGNIEEQAPRAPYAGPGHWNDPDMLEIGNGHMTDDEYRTHMSLWALTAAPLLAGNDIRSMSETTKSILLNKEVIAIDQDALGKQASPVKHGDLETWAKPLADGSIAVGIVNHGSAAQPATVHTSDLNLKGHVKSARDLWTHKDVTFTTDAYTATVPSHGVLLLKVSAK